MGDKQHWENVYRKKGETSVSWFQEHATLSMDIIRHTGCGKDACIIDVGGGASVLVDDLIAAGYGNVTVLDISAQALQAAQRRLGSNAARVTWLEADIIVAAMPECFYDVWHDRAVFHFLTKAADRVAYVAAVRRAVKPGGHVIVATFGPQGPLQCSGLPIVRYSPDELHDEFGAHFKLVEHREEAHHTPAGKVQQFVYCYCKMMGN